MFELTSLVLLCNRDNLPNELLDEQGAIKYRLLLTKVVVPFFSIRSRFVPPGILFNIG